MEGEYLEREEAWRGYVFGRVEVCRGEKFGGGRSLEGGEVWRGKKFGGSMYSETVKVPEYH